MKKQKQGYIKNEHKTGWYERNQLKICGGIILVSAAYLTVPVIRQELKDLHLTQVKVAESLRILEALAEKNDIQPPDFVSKTPIER